MSINENRTDDEERPQIKDVELQNGTKFDVALEKAGSWGIWQKTMCVIICCTQMFSAMHSVGAVFLSASLNHLCKLPFEVTESEASDLVRSLSFPIQSFQCTYFKHNYTEIDNLMSVYGSELRKEHLIPFLSKETAKCQEWNYESEYFETSAVSEWNLVCSRKLLRATVQATFMGGILVGSALFGQVSDRIGRRKTILFCALFLVITSVATAFVNSYFLFLILRFVVACLCAGLMVTNFVLVMEIIKPEARTFIGMLNGVPFGIGISVEGLLAYFLRDWRTLQLGMGIFDTILLIFFWILPESPRWLATKGRYDEALDILKSIAKWNKKELPKDKDMILILKESSSPVHKEKKKESQCAGCTSFLSDQITLVRTPIMRRRCLIGFFVWFVSSMVYYGLIFSSANIKANPFVLVIASGLVEVPAFILTAYLLFKFGRRVISCSLFFTCSVFLFALIGIPSDKVIATFIVSNAGKFFNTSVFQLCYLYTSELVPTGVRNVAVGTSSMFARIGSSAAPYILDVLGELHYSLPSVVFGALSLAAGLLTLLLPETMNRTLPQTVEEVEAKKK